jgi:hypothetical protein
METSVAAGVRRIEAVTAAKADELYYIAQDTLNNLKVLFNNSPDVVNAIHKFLDENASLKKQIEQFTAETCSMTPYHGKIGCETRLGGAVPAGGSDVWELYLDDFPGLKLTEGEYAVYYDGAEAKFSVQENAAEPETDGVPDMLFCMETTRPDDGDGTGNRTELILLMKDGTLWGGAGGLSRSEISELFRKQALGEHYQMLKKVDADAAQEQYLRIKDEVKNGEKVTVIYPEAQPAVEAPRTVWYTEIPLNDDASQHITMGSEFCGTFSETDNEAVNAVCAWFREVCTREE